MIKKRETALKNIKDGRCKIHLWDDELLHDYDLLLEASKCRNSSVLLYAPKDLITEELCLNAMANGASLSRIPEDYLTQEMCNIAFDQSYYQFRYVPEKFQSETMQREAIKFDPSFLRFIQHPSYEICMQAVSQDGRALEQVPDHLRDDRICLTAIKSDGNALRYVNGAKITEALCFEAAKSGCRIEYIPPRYKTDLLYYTYVKAGQECSIPLDLMRRAFDALFNETIIPTTEEESQWKKYISETLAYLAESFPEYEPVENESLSTLLDKFCLYMKLQGGYKKVGDDRFSAFLLQEYKARYK